MQLLTESEREPKTTAAPRPGSGSAAAWSIALVVVLIVVGVVHWRAGVWQAGYGAYPDEPAHFMGGLMVRDFIVSGSHSPIAFAENYYLFQPFFAIGHWPPLFYAMEGIWMLAAGYSRTSVMLFTGLLAALSALLLFAGIRRRCGTVASLAIAAAFLAIPTVQWSSSVVMTDMCVALFSLATTLAAGRYLETREWRWAILTGLAASLALLTKYLAAFVLFPPLLVILIDRRWDILRNVRTWMVGLIVAALCTPWVLWSRRFLTIGLDVPRSDLWSRIAQVSQSLHSDFGNILGAWALIATIWALARWRRLDDTERLFVLSMPCMAAFMILGPQADMEPRYLMPGYLGVLAISALALHWVGLRNRILGGCLVAALGCLVVFDLAVSRIVLQPNVARKVARDLIFENPGAVLVPAEREGPIIAELASAEPVRDRILMIRPSKLLARMSWSAVQYELLVPDIKAMTSLFDRYPIDVIITARDRTRAELPHERLLREMIASDPRWILERRYAEPGVDWDVYRRPANPNADREALTAFVRAHLPSVR